MQASGRMETPALKWKAKKTFLTALSVGFHNLTATTCASNGLVEAKGLLRLSLKRLTAGEELGVVQNQQYW